MPVPAGAWQQLVLQASESLALRVWQRHVLARPEELCRLLRSLRTRFCSLPPAVQRRWLCLLHLPLPPTCLGPLRNLLEELRHLQLPKGQEELGVLYDSLAYRYADPQARRAASARHSEAKPEPEPEAAESVNSCSQQRQKRPRPVELDAADNNAEKRPKESPEDELNEEDSKLLESTQELLRSSSPDLTRRLALAPAAVADSVRLLPDVVQELLLLPLQRLEALLQRLCGRPEQQVTEANVALLCETLASSDSLSLRSSSIFLRICVCPLIQALDAPASRLLFCSLQALATSQPSAVSSALLYPVVQDPAMGSAQTELINRLLKQCYEPSSRQPLLHHIVHNVESWSPNVVKVINALLLMGVEIDEQLMPALVVRLEQVSQSVTANLPNSKFASLLCNLTSKYSARCLPHKDSLRAAASRLTSMMKKLALRNIDKL